MEKLQDDSDALTIIFWDELNGRVDQLLQQVQVLINEVQDLKSKLQSINQERLRHESVY